MRWRVCKVFGHKWRRVDNVGGTNNPTVVAVCYRCYSGLWSDGVITRSWE